MADDTFIIADIERPECIEDVPEHFTYPENDRSYYDVDTDRVYIGYCWKLCPYSTQWYAKYELDGYYRRIEIIGTAKRHIGVRVPAGDQTDHTLTQGTMRFHQVGPRAGFLCDDPACRYKLTHGKKFFEV